MRYCFSITYDDGAYGRSVLLCLAELNCNGNHVRFRRSIKLLGSIYATR